MGTKIVYKNITFYVDPAWDKGVRQNPYIHFAHDDNFLEAVKTGKSFVLYEILTEWHKTDQCKRFYDAEEFYDPNYERENIQERLKIWWNSNLSTIDPTDFYESMGRLKYRPNTPEEIYEEDLKTIREMKELLINEFIKDRDKAGILEFLSTHKPRVPKLPTPGYIYLIFSSGLYKIGKAKDLKNRTSYFATHIPIEVSLVHSFHSSNYSKAETILHRRYKDFRKTGEWFDLSEDQVKEICAIKDDEL